MYGCAKLLRVARFHWLDELVAAKPQGRDDQVAAARHALMVLLEKERGAPTATGLLLLHVRRHTDAERMYTDSWGMHEATRSWAADNGLADVLQEVEEPGKAVLQGSLETIREALRARLAERPLEVSGMHVRTRVEESAEAALIRNAAREQARRREEEAELVAAAARRAAEAARARKARAEEADFAAMTDCSGDDVMRYTRDPSPPPLPADAEGAEVAGEQPRHAGGTSAGDAEEALHDTARLPVGTVVVVKTLQQLELSSQARRLAYHTVAGRAAVVLKAMQDAYGGAGSTQARTQ